MTTSPIPFFILALTTLPLLATSFPNWQQPPPSSSPESTWSEWASTQITKFYSCVNRTSGTQTGFSDGFYDPNFDPQKFTSILNSTAENLRCLSKTLQKPLAIFTPSNDAQVQAAVQCAPPLLLDLRVRCGGHDYEGLSYISYTGQPFIILDLRKLNNVEIDIPSSTAWVEAGATVGALYYKISQKSNVHGFPAGLGTDLGIGGHITGGGYGSIMRKYGLAVDNVLDAEMVDARGKILNRKSMGKDLFWAICGGGGNNFGVLLRWKIKLVPVPETVTVFSISHIIDDKGMEILNQWQTVGNTVAKELFIRIFTANVGPSVSLNIYQGLYLGNKKKLLRLMNKSFPKLGLIQENCTEMSWIESVIFVAGFNPPIKPVELLNGKGVFLNYFKAKSDYVTTAIPEDGLREMLSVFQESGDVGLIVWTPYGGKVSEYEEGAKPFPHRKVLYKVQYVANWKNDSAEEQLVNEVWIRRMYDVMGSYVSKEPRQVYVNYRDLDIGKPHPDWNCSDPSIWGPKYYKGNYQKLVQVKTMIDPYNLFHNEQSIPTRQMVMVKFCVPFDYRTKW